MIEMQEVCRAVRPKLRPMKSRDQCADSRMGAHRTVGVMRHACGAGHSLLELIEQTKKPA